MFEAAALQVETASQLPMQSGGQDPMQTRWVINFVRDKFVEGSKCGFGELAFAKWQKLAHFIVPEEIHSTDDDPNFPRERMVTKTALSAERYLDAMLGGKTLQGQDDPHKEDWGIRFGFHGEESEAKMAVISATILPSLPEIRQIAQNYRMPSPIGDRCVGEDTVGFGERQSCPTCWSLWIQSDCCMMFMREVAENGRQVEVTDVVSRESRKQTIRPTFDELEASRTLTADSLRFEIMASQKVWVNIATELENKERRGIDVYQKALRQDIHALKPREAGLNTTQERVTAPMSVVGNDFTDEEMAKIYADRVAAKQLTEAFEDAPPPTIDITEFAVGQPVLCEGLPGVIAEVKSGGWFDVKLDGVIDGLPEGRTVRKDKLQRREI